MPGINNKNTVYKKDINSIERGYILYKNKNKNLSTNFDVVVSRAYNIIQFHVRKPEFGEKYFSLVEEAQIGISDFFTQTGDKSAVHTVLSYKIELIHAIDYVKNLTTVPIYIPNTFMSLVTALKKNIKSFRFTRIPRTYFYYLPYKEKIIIVPFNFLRFWVYPEQKPAIIKHITGKITMTTSVLKKRKIKVGDIVICNKAFYPGIKKNEDTFKILNLGKYDKDYYIADIKNKKGVVFTVKLTHLKKYNKV